MLETFRITGTIQDDALFSVLTSTAAIPTAILKHRSTKIL
jgi:hypothetical protein